MNIIAKVSAAEKLWQSTGLCQLNGLQLIMMAVGGLLLFLAIRKKFEPLLLVPIGFGCILANIPGKPASQEAPDVEHLSVFVTMQDKIDPGFHAASKETHVKEFGTYETRFSGFDKFYREKEKTTIEKIRETVGKLDLSWKKKAIERKDQEYRLVSAAFWSQRGGKNDDLKKEFAGWMDENGAKLKQHEYSTTDGFLMLIYKFGVVSGLFPLLIFMGVGAMTDFGPLLANPKTALLGAAAQFGIFTTLIGALLLPGVDFSLADAGAIGIIGGADGPTSIYTARLLAPDLLGAIAVAAYSYMALVPIIQPPIMKLFTSKEERQIEMKQLRHVSQKEKLIFPLVSVALCALLLPDACPLIGCLMFGNLAKETGVVDRLSDTMQNALINIVTIMLGLAVGMKLAADKFLNFETIGILVLGLVAFSVGTAAGVLMAKVMNLLSKEKINPLIGSAGVSAVPMAARVSNKVGMDENPHNMLLMHAMGPNVAGVIGSAVAAGLLIALCG